MVKGQGKTEEKKGEEMISRRAKGNQFQDWVEDFVLKTFPDAVVHNQKTYAKLIKYRDKKTHQLKEQWISVRNDIFGAIDLIVITPTHRKTMFIQATEHPAVTKRLKELEKIPWHFDTMAVYLFQKRKRGRVAIKQLQMNEGTLELTPIGEIVWGKFVSKIEKIKGGLNA